MKAIYCINIFLLGSFGLVSGQGYHKFLDNNAWYEYVFGFTGGAYYWYYKSNDTLINSVNYTIIRTSTAQAEYYVREDTAGKKVYMLVPPNPEYVLYDFSLLPGATFTYQSVTFFLDSITSFSTPLGNRNKFYYHNIANPSFREECIEGIGSTEDPMTFKVFISDPVWVLICSYVGTTEYYYNGVDTCAPNIYTGIAHQEANSLFSIFPNPLTSSSVLQFREPVTDAEVVISDALGQIMSRSKLSGSTFKMDQESLKRGCYIVSVRINSKQYFQKILIQ
jgi:hypothetical protein